MNARAQYTSGDLIQADHWRWPMRLGQTGAGASGVFTEWHHYILVGDAWSAIFNLNIDADAGGRSILILHDEQWCASIATFPPGKFNPGGIDATFSTASVRWDGKQYRVQCKHESAELELSLLPVSRPCISHGIGPGASASISWCLVPQMLASGTLSVGGTVRAFSKVPAYHDHNWGALVWDGDFSWEWGLATGRTASDTITIVFARMCDRSRSVSIAHSMFLVIDGEVVRYFRDHEVSFSTGGTQSPPPDCRIPAAAALLVPDVDHDVPQIVRIVAVRGNDRLDVKITSGRRCQILVPRGRNTRRVTRLNEVHAELSVRGLIGGKRFDDVLPCILEFVNG